MALHGQAHALAVDSELLLLVDVSQWGLNKNEFETVLNGYSSALSSSQVLSSIQSGTHGRIAISLMIFGNSAYYTANVVGTTLPGVAPVSTTSAINSSALAAIFSTTLSGNPGVGISAVPEPSSAALVLVGACVGLAHRRRS